MLNNQGKKNKKFSVQNLKRKIAEELEIPSEVVTDVPKLTAVGRNELLVENYMGIIEYQNGLLRVNTTNGIINITGENLLIKEITSEEIIVKGDKITNISYTV